MRATPWAAPATAWPTRTSPASPPTPAPPPARSRGPAPIALWTRSPARSRTSRVVRRTPAGVPDLLHLALTSKGGSRTGPPFDLARPLLFPARRRASMHRLPLREEGLKSPHSGEAQEDVHSSRSPVPVRTHVRLRCRHAD